MGQNPKAMSFCFSMVVASVLMMVGPQASAAEDPCKIATENQIDCKSTSINLSVDPAGNITSGPIKIYTGQIYWICCSASNDGVSVQWQQSTFMQRIRTTPTEQIDGGCAFAIATIDQPEKEGVQSFIPVETSTVQIKGWLDPAQVDAKALCNGGETITAKSKSQVGTIQLVSVPAQAIKDETP